MQLVKSAEYKFKEPTIVTIGTFDGVHLGHQKIIEHLIAAAHTTNFNATILTFFPHPRMVLQQDSDLKLINTIEERIQLLEKAGIDNLFVYPFDKDFSRLSAEEYVEKILVEKINAKSVVIGYDHRFGRNRTANIDQLRIFGETYGFDVDEITAEVVDDVSVSSTKIRKALLEKDLETANTYLGYDFFITGTVTHGRGIGKQLHYPTANIHIAETYKLIPAIGVYLVYSYIDGKKVFGMLSIGHNPTIGANIPKTIEVNFFGIDKDLYTKKIQVHFLEYLRGEEKFGSLEALKEQLDADKKQCLSLIAHKYAE
ncbi:riboflavin kinase / FMN adenylyltransferase [Pustulibacterium marinum]|uniref:Riboflavin biosynthesis protein n=1 Tax=Pustulibacterium marinum TaxID=1224947 RepID=A0A1I7I7D5_9FLAO|nr:bifunctional riboflavin kinase/FAD synthetase [Pustulibacterium marinum]SFU68895.1 riboflavin kinase / FMN adenylyltransferase [Pustulibacterium marinum]